MREPPCDVGIFTFIAFKWNRQKRSSYPGATPHVLAMKPIMFASKRRVINNHF